MNKILLFFSVLLVSFLLFGIPTIAEEITLTTYYPAPYGNYEELQVVELAVGSGATMPTTDGDIVADGTIRANTAFNLNGDDGVADATYTVVTDVQLISGPILQKKTRTITVKGGIITNIGSESGWK